jgi:hypothetical protein
MRRDWPQAASDAIRRNDHRNILAIGGMEWLDCVGARRVNLGRAGRAPVDPAAVAAALARQSRWESRDNQDENAPVPG